MTSSVDGLVSGLSTSSMISQLMQVESAPQTKLKTKVKTAETAVNSYQSVNSKLKDLKSAADTVGQLSTWRAVKASSNSSTVTATASNGLMSASGSVTFDVTELAQPQGTSLRVNAGSVLATSVTITPPGKYKTDGTWQAGTPVVVTVEAPATGKPEELAAAINAKNLDVRAHFVKTTNGEGVLQFSTTKTGAEYGFSVSGLEGMNLDPSNGGDPVTSLPTNAVLKVGTGASAFEVTSATNTFTGLLPSVTVTVSKKETGVTVSAAPDVSGIADKVQKMVDAMNATLTEIQKQTAYDPATKKGSPLTGDFMVREMTQTFLSAVSTGLPTYTNPRYDSQVAEDPVTNPKTLPFGSGSLSQFGIQLTRDGQVTFDAAAFTRAYNEDPLKMRYAATDLAEKFEAIADKQSTSVTSVILGRKNEIDAINSQISNWDVRLASRREMLQKQYAGLETTLGKLKSQSSWLSGQIASLG